MESKPPTTAYERFYGTGKHEHLSSTSIDTHNDEFGIRRVHYCPCGDYQVETLVGEFSMSLSEWRTKNYNLED